jgi:gluconate kinase
MQVLYHAYMENKLIVVFGKPGAGKSYVAHIIAETFGYLSYNGDEALPLDMKKLILEKSDVTTEMRTRFVENISITLNHLFETNTMIVLHQALIKEHMRVQLQQAFPQTIFVWVDCDHEILKKRYMKREYFNLGLEYLQVMIDAFESPKHPHVRILNDTDGSKDILKQLQELKI